jgi:D-lactate dehydrogenase
LDVFEGEKKYIFKDMTKQGFKDDPELGKLVTYDNVIISSHIAFYTDQAVEQITTKTLSNYNAFVGKEEKDEKAIIC